MASKLSQLQARFQQKQMQEKEEKLLRLYESQQQRAIERVNRGSAGSITSPTSNNTMQGGKVRQMFDERRQKAGIDRSYPLEPLRVVKSNGYNSNNNHENTKTVVKTTTVKKQVTQVKNGKPLVNKREVVHSIYNNNDGDESYEEHVYTDNNLNRPILNRTYKRRDLEMMMREHNRNENIEDEEFPDIDIDQFEEPIPKPKLNNIRSVSPVRNTVLNQSVSKTKTITRNDTVDKSQSTPKKESKPFIKKVAKSTPKNSVVKEASSSSKSFTPSSLVRTNAKNSPGIMSSKSPTRKSIDNARAQSGAKSSGKQPGRGSIVNRDDLNTCRFCNRRFADDRLAVHEDICSKTAKKQRKTYDATKHRVQGTELEPYARKLNRSMTQKMSNPTITKSLPKQQSQHQSQGSTGVKKTDWRRKHEEFIGAIRAAKMAQAHVAAGGKLSDLPPPPPSENPDYVQCPHCGRRFNQTAAERHIPKCATYEFNKQKPARPGGRK